jgi:nucleotide-binding universal stress UspA family protein
MLEQETALVCVGPEDAEWLVEAVSRHLSRDSRLVLLYVIDTGPEHHMEQLGHRMRAGHQKQPVEHMAESALAGARAILADVHRALAAAGYSQEHISERVEVGEPGREIARVAAEPELGVGLVVIAASYERGPSARVGPKSVSPGARFVLDHSPRDVLLLRPADGAAL